MRHLLPALLLFTTFPMLQACSGDAAVPAASVAPSSSVPPTGPTSPRGKLAARAAAAKDLRQAVLYTLKTAGRPDREIAVTRATDGSWRVDIPGGAHDGAVDIALLRSDGRLYQCSTGGGERRGCVAVRRLAKRADPKLQHLITDWLDVLTDRDLPLAISMSTPLPGSTGECYTVDSSATSVSIPIDVGIYCFEPDGTLSAARFSAGTLTMAHRPTAAPASVSLPGPMVSGEPLTLDAPPSPAPSPSASGSPSPAP